MISRYYLCSKLPESVQHLDQVVDSFTSTFGSIRLVTDSAIYNAKLDCVQISLCAIKCL
jgi:hypothetical protein